MAYRKTPAIEAGIERRRDRLIAATLAIAASRGAEHLTVNAISTRARLAHGLAYKYFPDKEEMIAAAVERLRAKHIRAIERAGENAVDDPTPALARCLAVLFACMGSAHLNALTFASPVYRNALREAVERLLAVTRDLTARRRRIASAAILGAARDIHEEMGSAPLARREFVEFALMIAGLSAPHAAAVAARYSNARIEA